MRTPISTWLAVAAIGGRLRIAEGGLRMLLPADCPPELKDAIRQHKAALLQLVRLDFLTVRSDALNATIFWTPDEATKEALVFFGASPGSVYTAAELQHLVHCRVTVHDLPLIHTAKRQFDGTVR